MSFSVTLHVSAAFPFVNKSRSDMRDKNGDSKGKGEEKCSCGDWCQDYSDTSADGQYIATPTSGHVYTDKDVTLREKPEDCDERLGSDTTEKKENLVRKSSISANGSWSIDPAKVTRCALQNATSVGGMALST
ncbi:hypothetical protein DY000_02056964 [Brassica cretica]|uniref:Uncharacterized protein n=1 Tax=Brassica cretica TaxID=69181 RepID=A0ABQ7AEW9_BRACR|nr:hypothetical protein DY000_02056964 [Brassica cretica]